MNKLLPTILISALVITGCGLNSTDKPAMSDEDKAVHEQELEEALEGLNKEDITQEEELTHTRKAAAVYEGLGEYEKAIEYYEKALVLEPEDFVTLNNLAEYYEDIEDYTKASEYILKLYQANLDQMGVAKDAIRMLTKDGQFDEAQRVFDEFVANNQIAETDSFVIDQGDYIKRMRNKAEGSN